MSKVSAQVYAAGCSYFTREKVIGPDGEQRMRESDGAPMFVEHRHEATKGDIIELDSYEFERLKAVGVLREPSDEALFPANRSTPFGVPLETDEHGQWIGPVMGDPRAQGDLTEEEIRNKTSHTVLTPEEARELEAQAAGRVEGDFDAEEATEEELKDYVQEKGLGVEATLALVPTVEEDGDVVYDANVAQRLLDAELSREKPRKGVVAELEEILEEDE